MSRHRNVKQLVEDDYYDDYDDDYYDEYDYDDGYTGGHTNLASSKNKSTVTQTKAKQGSSSSNNKISTYKSLIKTYNDDGCWRFFCLVL